MFYSFNYINGLDEENQRIVYLIEGVETVLNYETDQEELDMEIQVVPNGRSCC